MAATASHPQMFTGEYPRLLDAALRVNMPKGWRSLKISEFYLISGSAEPYIKALPQWKYEAMVAEIMNDPHLDRFQRNAHLRSLGSQCKHAKIDPAGRLTLPSELCEEIGIGPDHADLLLIGAIDSFEVWPKEKFKEWLRKQDLPGENGVPKLNVKAFLGV